jgi:tRNA-specific 2-thiouridylase
MSQKVYVGMSGGVDSSVTAALLKQQGYDVTGVFMKNWTRDLPGVRCPWAEDLADAKRVATKLDIPFKVFDFEKEYKHLVVDYMIDEYKAGRTPNPDIMCNQEVKFKLFLVAALEAGADFIATGHYARIKKTENGSFLALAKDTNKDQTYFLYRISQHAVDHTLMPLGDFDKPEVRVMAEEWGLSTAQKKDSQGICFVGNVGMHEFLSEFVEATPGNIIDKKTNQVVGRHDGAIFYTIGQRHGLDLGGGLPYYVVGKDMEKNEVYVSAQLNDEALWKKTMQLTSLHWISQVPQQGETYQIRTRHRAPLLQAKISLLSDKELTLELDHEERAVTPGQSTVIYNQDGIVLGGGIVQ